MKNKLLVPKSSQVPDTQKKKDDKTLVPTPNKKEKDKNLEHLIRDIVCRIGA